MADSIEVTTKDTVAPLVGAWIEISLSAGACVGSGRRSSRGSVD